MSQHVVVVGASLAGLRAVQALRRNGHDGRITLVGAETHHPYDRPPLSKDLLVGTKESAALSLIDDAGLAALDIDQQFGVRATDLDLATRQVSLHGRADLSYDTLIIATGSAPRTLALAETGGAPLAGVHYLRTLDDAMAIRSGFERGARVAVIGGGFIGAELASSARSLGLDVTIIDPLPVLMSRGLGPILGEVMTNRHRDHGVTLRLGVGVAGLAGSTGVESVLLSDGTSIPADLVVIGIGTAPATDWLAASGLQLRDGVVCDQQLRAVGTENVYAIGDVARWDNPRYPQSTRMEHWTSAGEQAAAVAATLTGTPTTCAVLPYVWSDQFGQRLQVFGQVGADDEVEYVHGTAADDQFAAVTRSAGGALSATIGVSAMKHLLPYRKELLTQTAP